MDKEYVVHICNGILLSHKKEWNNAICSNMDGPRDYHITKVGPTKINIIWYHLYVESQKMIQMNLFIKQNQTHRPRKQAYGRQRGNVWAEG